VTNQKRTNWATIRQTIAQYCLRLYTFLLMRAVEAFRLHHFTISLKVITTLPILHHTVVYKTMMIGTL